MYNFSRGFPCRIPSGMRSKISLIVKLVVIILFASLLQVNAAGYAQQVSLSVKNTPLNKVFEKLNEQTGLNFIYNTGMIKDANSVTISLTNVPLKEALDACLANEALTYVIFERTVVIQRRSLPKAQLIDVGGTIKDSKGEPIPGVNVKIKGTNTGTVSNIDGVFSIKVPDGSQTLVFSAIGFETQEIQVVNNTKLNITLKDKISDMAEVVVVGYGSQKKSDITGSIASVNEQALKSVPAPNLLNALQGQAPGLDIQKSGGNSHPGATPSVVLRGVRSLGASRDVLYIVDGIPYNADYINDLNQNDVTSVEILKDASATAIYGSRGANGVILITTRKGKAGKALITYNAFAGTTRPRKFYDVMDAKSYETFRKWAFYNANNPNVANAPNPYNGINDPKFYTDGLTFLPVELESMKLGLETDWQKLIFKTGFKTDHQVSVSGGTDNTQYAISGGFYNETGIFPGILFRRYSLKVSVDHRLSKYVKLGVSSINGTSDIYGESINPLPQAVLSSPLTQPYDAQGNLIPFPGNGSLIYNPLANLVPGAVVQERRRYNMFTSAYAEVQITPKLRYRFNGGVQITPETYGDFFGSKTYENLSGLSTARNSNYNYYDYTLENLLVYDNTFAKDHHITVTGLFSFQEDYKAQTTFRYNNILADYAQYFNPALGSNLRGEGSYAKFNIVSYMARINYAFKSKYLLTLTGRSDGSSTLAPGNKYHFFPSVGAGWNISEEGFMKEQNTISSLKLRLGYGTVGNAAVSPYQTLGNLTTINYNYGSTNVTGTYPSNVPNPQLGWEYTTTFNAGVDFGVLRDRITGSIDVYRQATDNLILQQNLPITTGYSAPFFANVGKTENKGLEINLSSVNLKAVSRKNFGWTTNLSVSFNRNKITALASGVTQDVGSNRFVGSSINTIYNYKRLGIWQNTPADSALAKKLNLTLVGSASVIGTVKVADADGNGVINTNDRMIIGSRDPQFLGGMTNRFTYRGFDLSIVTAFRVGGLLLATQYQPSSGLAAFTGKSGMMRVNYWTPSNGENYFPKPNSNQQNPAFGDLLGIFDASYLKIRTINLGYTFTPALLDRFKLKSLRFYTSLNDAFILFSPFVDKFNGIDPESAGSLGTTVPPTKSLLFGLNVSF